MYKIKTKSWHYSIAVERYSFSEPYNLCSYMRALIASLLITSALTFVATSAISVLFGIMLSSLADVTNMIDIHHSFVLFSMGIIGLSVILASGVLIFVFYGSDMIRLRFKSDVDTDKKEESLISAWFKSKLDKMCVMLTYDRE